MSGKSVAGGVALGLAARSLAVRALRWKFARDVRRLNAGDASGLISAYAEDAVLSFTDGDHRFAGEWRGKAEIARFLENFTAAGMQGEIKDVAVSGPPWALTIWARFDDHAGGPDGERIYANRTVLVLHTRWGKIVRHEDFYFDTAHMAEFDRRLTELGIAPVAK